MLASTSAEPNIDDRKIVYLQKIIDACKNNNIDLVMCYSPYYEQTIPVSIRIIEQLAKDNDIMFLNYGYDSSFQEPEYFQDAGHLNDTGAKEYGREIVNMLKHR